MRCRKRGHGLLIAAGTPEHPFYVDGRGWVEAGSLGIGTQIVTRAGPRLTVNGLDWQRSEEQRPAYTVYHFTIDQDHTCFVSTARGEAWKYNSGCTCLSSKTFPHRLDEMDSMIATQACRALNIADRLPNEAAQIKIGP